jgi:hypothetical protein
MPRKPKPASRATLISYLRHAQSKHWLVTVHRRIPETGEIEGYVVGIGKKWVLLQTPDDARHLNEHVAMKIVDVVKVDRRDSVEAAVRELNEIHDAWPPRPPDGGLPLDATRRLIKAAARIGPVVTFSIEWDEPTWCFIGVPVTWRQHEVDVAEISPQGRWKKKPKTMDVRRITRIDLGGRYEAGLREIAGPPPPR